MNEQRERFERSLSECAESGVPADLDLWESIEAKVKSVDARSQRASWIPRSRFRWTLGIVVIFLFGTTAYAATEIFDISDRAEQIFLAEVPGVEQENLSVPLDLRQSKGGVDVTLIRAYADADNVVIGFSTNGLNGNGGQTVSVPSASLTDENGTEFRTTEGSSQSFPGETSGISNVIFFEPETKLRPGRHRFNLKVENRQDRMDSSFAFDFELPVQPVSTVVLDLDQEARSNGLTLTLNRIEFSPVVNRAVICPGFDARMDGSGWQPVVVRSGRAGEVGSPATDLSVAPNGCATLNLSKPLYDNPGRHRLMVNEIRQDMSRENPQGKKTFGPWIFDFDIPKQ